MMTKTEFLLVRVLTAIFGNSSCNLCDIRHVKTLFWHWYRRILSLVMTFRLYLNMALKSQDLYQYYFNTPLEFETSVLHLTSKLGEELNKL